MATHSYSGRVMWTLARYTKVRTPARSGIAAKTGLPYDFPPGRESRHVELDDFLPGQGPGEPEPWKETQIRNDMALVWVADEHKAAVANAGRGLPVWDVPLHAKLGENLTVQERGGLKDAYDAVGFSRQEYVVRMRDGARQQGSEVFADISFFEFLLFAQGGERYRPMYNDAGDIVSSGVLRPCNNLQMPPAIAMAFGDDMTSLDLFNRGQEDPLSGWDITGSDDREWIISAGQANVASINQSDLDKRNYIDDGHFGPDIEMALHVTSLDALWGPDDRVGLDLRITAEGTTGMDCYELTIESTNDKFEMWEVTNEVPTQMGADITSIQVNEGDEMGFNAVGDTMGSFYDTGAGWVTSATRTDETISAAGDVGIFGRDDVDSATWEAIDDFRAGTIAVSLTQVQEGYQMFNDDGNEASRTKMGSQDTPQTVSAETPFGVRVLVDVTGDPPTETKTLQWKLKTDADSTYRDVSA